MDPLTIVVSFDVGEQVMPGSIPKESHLRIV